MSKIDAQIILQADDKCQKDYIVHMIFLFNIVYFMP